MDSQAMSSDGLVRSTSPTIARGCRCTMVPRAIDTAMPTMPQIIIHSLPTQPLATILPIATKLIIRLPKTLTVLKVVPAMALEHLIIAKIANHLTRLFRTAYPRQSLWRQSAHRIRFSRICPVAQIIDSLSHFCIRFRHSSSRKDSIIQKVRRKLQRRILTSRARWPSRRRLSWVKRLWCKPKSKSIGRHSIIRYRIKMTTRKPIISPIKCWLKAWSGQATRIWAHSSQRPRQANWRPSSRSTSKTSKNHNTLHLCRKKIWPLARRLPTRKRLRRTQLPLIRKCGVCKNAIRPAALDSKSCKTQCIKWIKFCQVSLRMQGAILNKINWLKSKIWSDQTIIMVDWSQLAPLPNAKISTSTKIRRTWRVTSFMVLTRCTQRSKKENLSRNHLSTVKIPVSFWSIKAKRSCCQHPKCKVINTITIRRNAWTRIICRSWEESKRFLVPGLPAISSDQLEDKC